MAKTKAQKWADTHQLAMKRFGAAYDATSQEREQSLADRRFYSIAGAQWEGKLGENYQNRVQLEVNKVHLAVMRIVNSFRSNRVEATFVGKQPNNDEVANVCDELFRADREDSVAREATDNAFEEAAGGGFGAWRLIAEYEDEYDEDNDNQRIAFEPIFDADRVVYFDANALRQDKSDARFAFILQSMTRDAYIEEWGDDPASWGVPVEQAGFDWSDADLVYVAEYYVIEERSETVTTYKHIGNRTERFLESDLTEEKERELNAIGSIPVATRKVKRRAVHKWILSGGGILEDCGYIAGKEIPIVPVYGKRWYVEGLERWAGAVRYAKDAQRLKNMQLSSLAEAEARGSEETPIFMPEQISGHESTWATKAVNKPAFLLVNPIKDPATGAKIASGPVGQTTSAQVSPAAAALMQVAEGDLADVLGNQGGGEVIEPNISGRAVELIQSRLDDQSYVYIDNYAKAERRCAKIWLGMAAELYDEPGRQMRGLDESGNATYHDVGGEVLGDGGVAEREFDIATAKMDVSIEIGPATSTKKSATIQTLKDMLAVAADPQDQKVLSAAILRNIDGDGLSGIREYSRKQLVALGAEDPNDQEKEEMAQAAENQQPDPQTLYLMSEAQKNEAQAMDARADAAKAAAETQKTRAQTAEILANMDRADREQAMRDAEMIARAVGSGTMPPQSGMSSTGTTALNRER